MQLQIQGENVFAANGGRRHEPGRPLVLLVHGAGMDHTVWSLQSRWLAYHDWNVLALDLPGHGRSGGAALGSIAAIGQWLLSVIAAADAESASLVGHSMGSLGALVAAAGAPQKIDRLVLIGTAARMPVHADLLAAAAANQHAAIDMVNLWGFGPAAGLGGSRAPGLWMVGGGERILEQARPGVLHSDLAACDAYRDGLADAARVKAPTLLICGEKDQMTPLKSARALAAAIPCATLTVLRGAGHMPMAERPDELLRALAAHLDAKAAPDAGKAVNEASAR
jgi:pimeloyl-ACP methyl ester carboxylesterase